MIFFFIKHTCIYFHLAKLLLRKTLIESHCSKIFHVTDNSFYIKYTRLFLAPPPFTLANGFAPSWIRPDTVELDLKKDHIWDIWIRRILNFTADNKGEGSEN